MVMTYRCFIRYVGAIAWIQVPCAYATPLNRRNFALMLQSIVKLTYAHYPFVCDQAS
jgi:hypothetical protein